MKTVAFSDLHGNYNLWTKIKNYYAPDDVLIFLGDACDRGPDGIKIMLEMLSDKRIIYLKGNHEDMFLNYINYGVVKSLKEDRETIRYNDTKKTLEDYIKLPATTKVFLVDNLQKTKFYYIYINKKKKNIFLSHAGMNIEDINNIDENRLLWHREHIKNNNYNPKYEDWYIVHGHTPCQLIRQDMAARAYRYCNNHKIDIDIASYTSNKAVVIDLDTLEIKYFEGDKDIDE